MTTDLTIRPVTPEDVHTWRALRLEGAIAHPEAFMITPEDARNRPVEQDAQMLATGHRWFAILNDVPVGFVGLIPNQMNRAQHRAEIGPLYVTDRARGQGIARRLIGHAMEQARSLGVWQFELFVNDLNHAARRLYARLGFVETGAIPNAIPGAAGPERDILMIRTEPREDNTPENP